jgi:hypothetical protein
MVEILRKQVGRHTFEIDGDTLISRMVGEMSLEEMKAFYEVAHSITGYQTIYVISDMRQAGGIRADARRYAVAGGQGIHFGATVAFGINPAMRVMLVMLVRAAKIMNFRTGDMALEFVADEEAARALIAKLRQAAPG